MEKSVFLPFSYSLQILFLTFPPPQVEKLKNPCLAEIGGGHSQAASGLMETKLYES